MSEANPNLCFVASPISVYANDPVAEEQMNANVERICQALEAIPEIGEVYSAVREIAKRGGAYEEEQVALAKNKAALKRAKWFVLVMPERQLASGAVGELFVAHMLDIPSILVLSDRKHLPFGFRSGGDLLSYVMTPQGASIDDALKGLPAAIIGGQFCDIFSGKAPRRETLVLG